MQSSSERPSLFSEKGGQGQPQRTSLVNRLVLKILLGVLLAGGVYLAPILEGHVEAQTVTSTAGSITSCHSHVYDDYWHTQLYTVVANLYQGVSNQTPAGSTQEQQLVGTFTLTLFYCQHLDSFFARLEYQADPQAASNAATWAASCILRVNGFTVAHCSNATMSPDGTGHINSGDYADTQALPNSGRPWSACWSDKVGFVCTPSYTVSGSQSYQAPIHGYRPAVSQGVCGPMNAPIPYSFDGSFSHTCDLNE